MARLSTDQYEALLSASWRSDLEIKQVIGIDPGKKTGVAVWVSSEHRFSHLETLTFWTAYNFCIAFNPKETKIVIETSRTSHIWGGKLAFNRSMVGNYGAIISAMRRSAKMGQDVGGTRREAELLADGLKVLGYNVITPKPTQTKHDKKIFRLYTGHVGQSNEHERDAGMVAFMNK